MTHNIYVFPRCCLKCGHIHRTAKEAKVGKAGVYCTWCGDTAPQLVGLYSVVTTDNRAFHEEWYQWRKYYFPMYFPEHRAN